VQRPWRSSDIAVCFRLNQLYSEWPMQYLRSMAIGIWSLFSVYAFVVAYRRGTFGVLLSTTVYQLAASLLAASRLWKPEPAMLDVDFARLADRMKPGDWFMWRDLLSSAPSVVNEKLTAHATQEEYSELAEERDNEMRA